MTIAHPSSSLLSAVAQTADRELLDLIGTSPFPTFALADDASVLAANCCAREAVAASSPSVRIVGGRLHVELAANGASVATLLAELAAAPASRRRIAKASRSDAARWLVLDRAARNGLFLASLRSLADVHRTSAEALGEQLQLTPSEAALLSALIAADSVVKHAATCERETSTMRWHLRNLLTKTGCRSQRELVNVGLMLLL